MSNSNVVSLQDLSKAWVRERNKSVLVSSSLIPKSTDPLVDGTAMTINPEIQQRRKRIVSQQNYMTKRPHIAEFINACKFLAGETSKMFPLSTQHLGILSLIRNNKEVPEKYQSVVNNNLETVTKAATLKPKEIKAKYVIQTTEKEDQIVPERQTHVLSIDGITIKTKGRINQTKKCAEDFITWLVQVENEKPKTIEEPKSYVVQVKTFIRDKDNQILLPVVKQILEQKQWITQNYTITKKGKKQVLVFGQETSGQKVVKKEKIENTNKQSQLSQDFIAYLKSLGVTKFTIEF